MPSASQSNSSTGIGSWKAPRTRKIGAFEAAWEAEMHKEGGSFDKAALGLDRDWAAEAPGAWKYEVEY